MTDYWKFKSVWVVWIVLHRLRVAAQTFPGVHTTIFIVEAPDWDIWLSHFQGGIFYRQYRVIWDHSEWCLDVFNCRAPGGEVVHHQMCVYTWTKEAPSECTNFNDLVVHDTEWERTRILDVHNDYRNEVAGHGLSTRWWGASNMRRMTWNYNLEDLAINWALQCFPEDRKDNMCRRIIHFDYSSMQIERAEFRTNVTFSSQHMVEKWAETLARYHYTHPDVQFLHGNFTHGPWDRATMMIWATTYQLGCGVVVYTSRPSNPEFEPKKWYKTVACYYAPPGNKVGGEIFHEGAPGVCPEGTKTRFGCYGADYPNLCHVSDDPINKAIKPRTRSRGLPQHPLYSHLVEATITNPPPPPTTAAPTTRAPRRLQGAALIDNEPIAMEESSASELLASIAKGFPITTLTLVGLL